MIRIIVTVVVAFIGLFLWLLEKGKTKLNDDDIQEKAISEYRKKKDKKR